MPGDVCHRDRYSSRRCVRFFLRLEPLATCAQFESHRPFFLSHSMRQPATMVGACGITSETLRGVYVRLCRNVELEQRAIRV